MKGRGIAKVPISARRVIITSFAVDFSDVVFNLGVAMLTGSVVMLAEALQGGADLLTSTLLLVGIRRAGRRANRQYRFGHGRELFFWVLMAGVTMFILTATLSVIFGVQRLIHPQEIQEVWLTYLALGIGLASNGYALSLSIRRLRGAHVGPSAWQRFRHSSLIETKATLVLDFLGSASAVFGLAAIGLYQITGNARFDGIGSVTIGLATAVLAIILISSVKDLLVGRSATSDIEDRIRDAVMEVDEVQRVLDLRTMYLGSERLLVNVEVHMAGGLETRQIEGIIDEIKARVRRRAPIVSHIQVELETPVIREP
ncbi:MAG TPA: cation diffusion facilitator family transporter [Candidatus Saccharimonadia bacterium]|nr:cation diffusion facilitator family transporter [Candidatus Saccharimonadia bacterium]